MLNFYRTESFQSCSFCRAVWINLPLSILAVSLCALCGCVIYAFYADCDPISNKQIKKGDQVKETKALNNSSLT